MPDDEKRPLVFLYPDSDDGCAPLRREISGWVEAGPKIEGYCTLRKGVRSFIKERVIEWIDGRDQLANPDERTPLKLSVEVKEGIAFTGFSEQRKQELKDIAIKIGMRVLSDATPNIKYLVTATDSSGLSKQRRAREYMASVISEKQFLLLAKTGEADF